VCDEEQLLLLPLPAKAADDVLATTGPAAWWRVTAAPTALRSASSRSAIAAMPSAVRCRVFDADQALQRLQQRRLLGIRRTQQRIVGRLRPRCADRTARWRG